MEMIFQRVSAAMDETAGLVVRDQAAGQERGSMVHTDCRWDRV